MKLDRSMIIRIMFLTCLVLLCINIKPKKVYAYPKVKVVIDPGHGGPDDGGSNLGAVYDDYVEKDINLLTAFALMEELKTYQNVEVYMTRPEDIEMSLEDRIAYAKSVGADVVVSVHYNASDKHLFYGGEIFTSAYGRYYSVGQSLARCIRDEWINYERPFKEIKVRLGDNGDYYGLIRHGKDEDIPTIILEHGYIDNHIDTDKICNEATYKELGRLDAIGIAKYYGLSKNVVLAEIKPTVTVYAPEPNAKPDTTAPRGIKVAIDEIDREEHTISYSIEATESESRIAYYGIGLGMPDSLTDEDFADLLYWDSSTNVCTGMCRLPDNYDGYLTFRLYNSYELYEDSDAYYVNMTEDLSATEGDTDSDKKDDKTKADKEVKRPKDELDAEPKHTLSLAEDVYETDEIIDETFTLGDEEENIARVDSVENGRKSAIRKQALAGMIGAVIFSFIVLIVLIVLLTTRSKNDKKDNSYTNYKKY